MSDIADALPEEDERAILSQECRALYDELVARGLIEGTYAEWLAAAAKEAARKLAPPPHPEQPLVQVVRGALR